jgi:hypothetical protein
MCAMCAGVPRSAAQPAFEFDGYRQPIEVDVEAAVAVLREHRCLNAATGAALRIFYQQRPRQRTDVGGIHHPRSTVDEDVKAVSPVFDFDRPQPMADLELKLHNVVW